MSCSIPQEKQQSSEENSKSTAAMSCSNPQEEEPSSKNIWYDRIEMSVVSIEHPGVIKPTLRAVVVMPSGFGSQRINFPNDEGVWKTDHFFINYTVSDIENASLFMVLTDFNSPTIVGITKFTLSKLIAEVSNPPRIRTLKFVPNGKITLKLSLKEHIPFDYSHPPVYSFMRYLPFTEQITPLVVLYWDRDYIGYSESGVRYCPRTEELHKALCPKQEPNKKMKMDSSSKQDQENAGPSGKEGNSSTSSSQENAGPSGKDENNSKQDLLLKLRSTVSEELLQLQALCSRSEELSKALCPKQEPNKKMKMDSSSKQDQENAGPSGKEGNSSTSSSQENAGPSGKDEN